MRKEAHEMQEKARTAKAKRNPEWKSTHAKLKEIWKRIDEEEERIRKRRHRRAIYPVRWEGIWSVSEGARGGPRGGKGQAQPADEEGPAKRRGPGRFRSQGMQESAWPEHVCRRNHTGSEQQHATIIPAAVRTGKILHAAQRDEG